MVIYGQYMVPRAVHPHRRERVLRPAHLPGVFMVNIWPKKYGQYMVRIYGEYMVKNTGYIVNIEDGSGCFGRHIWRVRFEVRPSRA